MGKVILTMGDDPKMSSGYGQVWDNLLTNWTKEKPDWDFYHVGWQNMDRAHKTVEGYTMLPRKKDSHGVDCLLEYLMQYKPDVFVSLCDVGFQAGYMQSVFEAKKQGWTGKWVAYTPIDTHTWEAVYWDKIFDSPDVNVAMAEYGEKMMKEHSVPNVVTIPHGVDLETFKPVEDRELLKQNPLVKDRFVVGFVGRNQIRKMVDRLIKGFAQFSKGKEDVLLLLHTDLHPQVIGWDLSAILAKFEKEIDPDIDKFRKIILTKEQLDPDSRQRVHPGDMNDFYNMMDIFCFATGGEGFGLPAIECQAAGTPLMMTACTTAFELTDYGKHGFQIPVLLDKYDRYVTFIGNNGIENVFPDDVALAKGLEELYADWKSGGKKLKEESEKARNFAQKYDWGPIAKKWLDLFENGI